VNTWRIILFPLAFLYGGIVFIRNVLYDLKILKSYIISNKSIIVGNLSMGGTGKSPHSLYLWSLLKNSYSVSFLSRGYGRKTRGLLEVNLENTALEVGDEPLMFKQRVGINSRVVVCESRKVGVQYIRSCEPSSIIILDDAFQHRKVTAGFSILLTDYRRPYYKDWLSPVGRLREWRFGKKRANLVIVTKVPLNLSTEEKNNICSHLRFFPQENIFFSHLLYGRLISLFKEDDFILKGSCIKTILLVAGIANPEPLVDYLKTFAFVECLLFSDHYNFTSADILEIHKKFDTFDARSSIIITTEKDSVRLTNLLRSEHKTHYPWYYQSMSIKIDREQEFNTVIADYVKKN